MMAMPTKLFSAGARPRRGFLKAVAAVAGVAAAVSGQSRLVRAQGQPPHTAQPKSKNTFGALKQVRAGAL